MDIAMKLTTEWFVGYFWYGSSDWWGARTQRYFYIFQFRLLALFLASIFFWSWPCAMTRAVLRPFYSLSSLLWLSWGRRFPGNCSEYDVHRRIQGLLALPPFPLLGIIYFFIGVFRGIENILFDSTRLSDFNYPFFFSFSSPFFPSSLINFII